MAKRPVLRLQYVIAGTLLVVASLASWWWLRPAGPEEVLSINAEVALSPNSSDTPYHMSLGAAMARSAVDSNFPDYTVLCHIKNTGKRSIRFHWADGVFWAVGGGSRVNTREEKQPDGTDFVIAPGGTLDLGPSTSSGHTQDLLEKSSVGRVTWGLILRDNDDKIVAGPWEGELPALKDLSPDSLTSIVMKKVPLD